MQENSEVIYAVSCRLETARQKAIEQLSKEKWATIERFLEQCQAEGLTKALLTGFRLMRPAPGWTALL